MKIAVISTPMESTPPLKYGGTERVISRLTEGLVKRGHEVTLFATGDSKTRAKLIAFYETAFRPYNPQANTIHAIKSFRYIKEHSFDIVHNHFTSLMGIATMLDVPTVTTLHGDPAHFEHIFRAFPEAKTVTISDNQTRLVQAYGNTPVGRVYNAVETDEYPFAATSGEYLAFLGILAPHKGPHRAIEVAKKAGMPIKLAGKIDPPYQDFFDAEIKPQLDGQWVEYIGELDSPAKKEFLKGAYATLFPISWEEPFGLVMIESMACGTPVLAFRRGSVPEVVVHGHTGLIVDDIDEMVAALQQMSKLDRGQCRAYVMKHFHVDRMVDEYEALYWRILAGSRSTV